MKMNLRLKGKIILTMTLLLALVGVSIFLLVNDQVNKLSLSSLNTSLDSYNKLGYKLIDKSYPGDWKVEGGKLYKGTKLINEDTELVDMIKEATNSPSTIFLGDTRVSTNVMENGKRALGTKVSENVADTVIKKGEVYQGEVKVLNSDYYGEYQPIKDSSGKVIGIWFMGIEKSKIDAERHKLILFIGLIIILFIILGIGISILFVNPIVNNVKKILNSLKMISEGDLTITCTVNSSDETGDIAEGLNNMCRNVSSLVTNIKLNSQDINRNAESLSSVSEQMSSSSEEVARAIQDVAGGTGNQTETLIGITSIFSGFAKQIQEIARNIEVIQEKSLSIESSASNSNKDLEHLVDSVNNISSSFKEFMDKISLLTENINQIDEIANIINSISDQTNLLALNAAIEAARAGESGRGFAVVAEEVRKLAERTKSSSIEINKLINTISSDSDIIVKSGEGMNEELNKQVNVINYAIGSFKKIILSVEQVIPMIKSVSNASVSINKEKDSILEKVETASSISEEVAASSEEIAASAEQMSASAEEVTATAQSLNSMTVNMMDLVNKFKI
jgi:methyl-accepting chemotaxis protein